MNSDTQRKSKVNEDQHQEQVVGALRLAIVTVTETRLEVAWLSIWLLHRIRTKQVKVTSIGNMGLVCIRNLKAITMVLSNNICKLPVTRSPFMLSER